MGVRSCDVNVVVQATDVSDYPTITLKGRDLSLLAREAVQTKFDAPHMIIQSHIR